MNHSEPLTLVLPQVSVPGLVANLGIGGALFLSGVGEEMGVLPKRNRDREPSGGHGGVKA